MKKFPHITAAVLTNTSKPLEIIKNIIIPHLRPDQILVKIFYSGVCHSQLMEVKGLRGSDIWLPHMLGHEATAEIIQIGSGKLLTGLNRRMKIKQDFLNITTFNDIENFIKSHGENL